MAVYCRHLHSVAVVLLVVIGCAVGGCEREENAEKQTAADVVSHPNIVFILVDALRADRLGAYGSAEGLSPNIDAIAKEGVVFERTVAPSPWTQPSVASLFSGVYPGVHKVIDHDRAFEAEYRGGQKVAVFSDSFETMAEVLKEAGYETAGFVANPYVRTEYGFGQGFDHFDASFAKNITPGWVVNDAALRWLDGRKNSAPMFLFLHYMDVHGPYMAPLEILYPMLDQVEKMEDKTPLSAEQIEALKYLRVIPPIYTDTERQQRLGQFWEYWSTRYGAGVRTADLCIGELAKQLNSRGLWDDALVVVVADHGEALCEHDLWGHGLSCYDTDLRIPLVMKWRGRIGPGERIDELARLVDVGPTVLDLVGLEPMVGVQGLPLAAVVSGETVESRLGFAEAVKEGPEQKAIYVGDWKLLATMPSGKRQLFDLSKDPTEQNDLYSEDHPIAKPMNEALARQIEENEKRAAGVTVEEVVLPDDELERLRSLGYVE